MEVVSTMECLYIAYFIGDRDAIDPYTIAASPSFGAIRLPSNYKFSTCDLSAARISIPNESKTSLLSGYSNVFRRDDLFDGASRSAWSQKTSLYDDFTGELPIAHGCSFTQTVFNGTQLLFTILSGLEVISNIWMCHFIC